jgi:uncharacterized membrane protein YdbT with pleckstrin-like domain
MSFIQKNLLNGENLVYRGRLHWIVFSLPILFLVMAFPFFTDGGNTSFIGGLFILLSTLTGIVSLINYSTSEFGITNKRVIVKIGFIRTSSVEVSLTKVEGIQVNQGILGRILGYGSLVVSGTGGTQDPFHRISNPLEFRRKAQEQIAVVQESK